MISPFLRLWVYFATPKRTKLLNFKARGGKTMKKTIFFFLVLVLSVSMGVIGQSRAQTTLQRVPSLPRAEEPARFSGHDWADLELGSLRVAQIQRLPLQKQQLRTYSPLPGMPANYPIATEAVSRDLRTVYVVSSCAVDGNGNPGTWTGSATGPSQILARRSAGSNRDLARLRLSDITRLVAIPTPRPVINPTTGRVYLAVYGAQNISAPLDQPSFPVMILEIDGTSLQVIRTLAYRPFRLTTPQGTQSEAPNPSRYLFMSGAWDAAYTIGMSSAPWDAGTEGSIAWSNLPAFVHNGTKYIQDVVEESGVRAAQAAQSWKFLNANPKWIPGTNHVLLSGYNTQTGVFPGLLEGSLSPATGLTPYRTLPYPGALIGFIGDRLYVSTLASIRSVPTAQLDAIPTFHINFPTIQRVEDGRQLQYGYNFADSHITPAGDLIIFGGSDGLFIYDVRANTGRLDASMIQYPMTSGATRTYKTIRSVHGSGVERAVLLRIDTISSPASGGIGTSTSAFQRYAY